MAKDDLDLPTPPSAPKPRLSKDPVGIDRPIRGAFDAATPRDLATDTRGPLSNVSDVNVELQKDLRRRMDLDRTLPLGTKDRDKKLSMTGNGPLTLTGRRSMSGGRR